MSELARALRLTLLFAVFTGLVYTFVVTGIAQLVFPSQANGSLIVVNGQVVGSSLIGQKFASARYFQGRPGAYAADNSAGSNLGPNSKVLSQRVAKAAAEFRQENGLAPDAPVPVDIVTGDFTGFDPDISEAAALLQVDRVATARGLLPDRLRALVERQLQGRILWLFGEPHVNVLELNLALDRGEAG